MTAEWRHRLFLAGPPLGLLLLAVFTPTDDSPTFCPFALCTGTACPGCGMTRAISALVRGDLDLALTYHPLVPLVMAQAAIAWVWYGSGRRGRQGPPNSHLVNVVLIGTTAALLVVWVVRLATGTLPPV